MPRKIKIKCKKCGTIFNSSDELNIIKTWHMVSPMPDKNGNLTITIMASWICPQCGAKNTGKISSIKSNSELRGKSPSQRLIDMIQQKKTISISELANSIGMSKENVRKALEYMIKKKIINALIEDNVIKVL
ncbi:MAG: DeoR family transcriptional regulator [Candidatus Njordarchaeota archaeon]